MRTGLSPYSNNSQRGVYSKNGGTQNPYRESNVYANNSPYAKNNNFSGKEVDPLKEIKKYKRFNDLKILNEQMINLSNNMQPEESPLEVLSQGQKGEIKNLLGARVFKISMLPAISAFILTTTAIISNSMIFVILAFFIYIFIIGRTFFYPAKLYYENIQCKTTRHAKLFYEEMDFWFKLGVVNIYIYLSIAALGTLITIFFEEKILSFFLNIANKSSGSIKDSFVPYVENMSFSASLFIIFLFYISTMLFYFRFISKEKDVNQEKLNKKIKDIKSQTLSRVEQIQENKNEI